MFEYNPNWDRWCTISINKHFDNGKGDTQCFVEGFTRDTELLADYIEVRVDGPQLRELTQGKWRLVFEVNILVVAKKGQDMYRLNRLKGLVAGLFLQCIEVRKWGNSPGDDETVIGCLKLLTPEIPSERIQVSNFGQIRPDTEILQASVEGHFDIHFD